MPGIVLVTVWLLIVKPEFCFWRRDPITPTLVIDGFPAVDHAELLTVEAFHTALVQHMKQLNKVKWLCPSHGRLMLSNKYVSAMQHCTEEILKAPDKWERYDYIPSLPGMIRCVD